MKKVYLLAIATAAVLVGCSSNDVVNDIPGSKMSREVPIGFNVQKQNITRATNLETVKHYNFGVFAWKVQGKNSAADQLVMDNYLVGFGGDGIGYEHTNATTWASGVGSRTDHTSPWFYEGLGTEEYKDPTTGEYYKKSDADYMSDNKHQYLRYWDLAYDKTNFYCYAPYNKKVTFTKGQETSTLKFSATETIRDGYDNPQNTEYANYSRALGEYMYASQVQATNAELKDVEVNFTHMGAQLFIRFYEEIPGYKVEIIDLDDDHGTLKSGLTSGYATKGIQAAPAIYTSGTYTQGEYYTHSGAEIQFTESNGAAANPTYSWDNSKKVSTPLMFKIPQNSDLEEFKVDAVTGKDYNTDKHYVIAEKVSTGTQKYSYSPTIYYPVAQSTESTTGFTFHISYRIIAEDNGEVTTVHNATVHVPVKGEASSTDGGTATADQYITAWQPNVKYTYTFRITKDTNGTTNPGTTDSPIIDPADPTPSSTKGLYPIVFDGCTITDFTESYSEYVVSEGTNYNQTNN